MSPGCRTVFIAGFVVASIVALVLILAAVGVFGGGKASDRARALQAKAVMKGLEVAIKSYKTEYMRLPTVPDPEKKQDDSMRDTSEDQGKFLLDVLMGDNPEHNPRHIRFWEAPPSKSSGAGFSTANGLVDPWGKNGYRVLLDDFSNGTIADPEKVLGDISGDVLIYSAGADGDFETWGDNVCSWK